MTSTTIAEPGSCCARAEPTCGDAGRRVFAGVCALLFGLCAAATVTLHGAMSSMAATPMPGGRTLSMAWTPMCGQTWAGAAASFIGMWALMMVAMMLPSIGPALWRYRVAAEGTGRAARLTLMAAVAYFLVWLALGAVVFVVGAALAALAMQWPELARAMPALAGVVVLVAGATQFTAWKSGLLAGCRHAFPAASRQDARAACRHGLRLGLHCIQCCAGATASLAAVGVMDLAAMAAATVAITAERLAPAGERTARAIGAAGIGAGAWLAVRGTGLL
ncbi:membrane protein [Cupriavidus sp. HPC(L)]|uniref:DUF2182 domain-containing protein n=1 Tax=Cupriavidus sp. HPC(L) TaxID=1217418 RepID=UPI000291A14C|nr:DUF2182 domain-containing protein [Cupriavidus sp. HPC(L)]ESH93879.1 membrane protein [Cupriavidus sp. HPC(L)]